MPIGSRSAIVGGSRQGWRVAGAGAARDGGGFHVDHPPCPVCVCSRPSTGRATPLARTPRARACAHTPRPPPLPYLVTHAHAFVHAPDTRTHLELVADLMLLDGGCFLPPDTEVPGGEHLDADGRPVVLAQKQPLWQPLHHPGGSRRPGPMGEGLRPGSGLGWEAPDSPGCGLVVGVGR